jgi:8-oxo-dGTP pyrophosphatase MutT (NUDIX family)
VSLGVRGLVFDEQGRVLLIRHSYLPYWHFPGGGVEYGETAPEALRRELVEEGGVALSGEPRLLGLFHHPDWTRGDHVAFFEAGPWTPCARRWGLEIEAAEFFPPDALPPDAHPSVVQRFAERSGAPAATVW